MTDLAESLDILKDFPSVPTKAWEASIHVDLKGEDYNKKLVWNSDEGIEVRPYYRNDDIKDLESQIGKVPATFPFVRGRGSQSSKQVESQGEVAADALAAWPAAPASASWFAKPRDTRTFWSKPSVSGNRKLRSAQ
jgi:hypothetical protein